MRIGKNNPFLAVDMLILDALVDGVQRPSENGISDVMGICLLYTSTLVADAVTFRLAAIAGIFISH